MKIWTMVLLLSLSLLTAGQTAVQKPLPSGMAPSLGLLKFSRQVFDDEKKRMGERFQQMEDFLAKRFGINHYFQDETVSYAEIEDPANIIDKAMTRNTRERLENFCLREKLDGIIFGHLVREDKLIVVLRVYFSEAFAQQRGIAPGNRVRSFRREMKVAKLTPQVFTAAADKMTASLETLVYGKRSAAKPKQTAPPKVQGKKTVKTSGTGTAATPPPKPALKPLYVTRLSFLDAASLSIKAPSKVIETVIDIIQNEIVRELTGLQEKQGYKVITGAKGHRVPNNPDNVNDVVNIVFDPNLTRAAKIKRITGKLMDPHRVDLIITGQYVFDSRNPTISFRPLLVVKSPQKLVTRNLQFPRQNILCTGANGTQMLCPGAPGIIKQAVKDFLKDALEK